MSHATDDKSTNKQKQPKPGKANSKQAPKPNKKREESNKKQVQRPAHNKAKPVVKQKVDPSKIVGGEFLFGFRQFVTEGLCFGKEEKIVFVNVQPVQINILLNIVRAKKMFFAFEKESVIVSHCKFEMEAASKSGSLESIVELISSKLDGCGLSLSHLVGDLNMSVGKGKQVSKEKLGTRIAKEDEVVVLKIGAACLVQLKRLTVGNIEHARLYDCKNVKLDLITFDENNFRANVRKKLEEFKNSSNSSMTIGSLVFFLIICFFFLFSRSQYGCSRPKIHS